MTTANEFKLPDVGEGLTEAEIVAWRVKVGDVVAVNDVVVEIETAKSIVELPSPYAGTVLALLAAEGDTVEVGTPVIRIGEPAEPQAPTASPPPPDTEQPGIIDTNIPPAGNATLVGYGPKQRALQRRARKGAPPVAAAPEVEEVEQRPSRDLRSVRTLAKPLVRRLARDLGVDLAALVPTGPKGTVSKEDVLAAAGGSAPAARPVAAAVTADAAGRETREPVKGVRRQMAGAMVASAFTAPHVTEWVTVDATATVELVERLRERRELADVKVSPLLVIARACLLALRRTPLLNSRAR